jgi:transcriptional regulator with XRE-family HTH domain
MEESLGPLLARVRSARGWSQLRVAELLCAASGTPTLTRHEVSRWERGERIPSAYWQGWLALVLDIPTGTLTAAARRARHASPVSMHPMWARLASTGWTLRRWTEPTSVPEWRRRSPTSWLASGTG